jgi:GNAT superfamily N-acetyltransferase
LQEGVIIARPGTDHEILATREIMLMLRPNIAPDAYLSTVRRMMQRDGYRLVTASEHGRVRAVAGFRFMERLDCARVLHVDDLVTEEAHRSRGFGKALLEWLKARAREHGCDELHLGASVQQDAAHRFCFRERMVIGAYHFRTHL